MPGDSEQPELWSGGAPAHLAPCVDKRMALVSEGHLSLTHVFYTAGITQLTPVSHMSGLCHSQGSSLALPSQRAKLQLPLQSLTQHQQV